MFVLFGAIKCARTQTHNIHIVGGSGYRPPLLPVVSHEARRHVDTVYTETHVFVTSDRYGVDGNAVKAEEDAREADSLQAAALEENGDEREHDEDEDYEDELELDGCDDDRDNCCGGSDEDGEDRRLLENNMRSIHLYCMSAEACCYTFEFHIYTRTLTEHALFFYLEIRWVGGWGGGGTCGFTTRPRSRLWLLNKCYIVTSHVVFFRFLNSRMTSIWMHILTLW